MSFHIYLKPIFILLLIKPICGENSTFSIKAFIDVCEGQVNGCGKCVAPARAGANFENVPSDEPDNDQKAAGPGVVTECERRIYISITMTGKGQITDEPEYIAVEEVIDPLTGNSTRLLHPLLLKIVRHPLQIIYPLYMTHVVNGEVQEHVFHRHGSSCHRQNQESKLNNEVEDKHNDLDHEHKNYEYDNDFGEDNYEPGSYDKNNENYGDYYNDNDNYTENQSYKEDNNMLSNENNGTHVYYEPTQENRYDQRYGIEENSETTEYDEQQNDRTEKESGENEDSQNNNENGENDGNKEDSVSEQETAEHDNDENDNNNSNDGNYDNTNNDNDGNQSSVNDSDNSNSDENHDYNNNNNENDRDQNASSVNVNNKNYNINNNENDENHDNYITTNDDENNADKNENNESYDNNINSGESKDINNNENYNNNNENNDNINYNENHDTNNNDERNQDYTSVNNNENYNIDKNENADNDKNISNDENRDDNNEKNQDYSGDNDVNSENNNENNNGNHNPQDYLENNDFTSSDYGNEKNKIENEKFYNNDQNNFNNGYEHLDSKTGEYNSDEYYNIHNSQQQQQLKQENDPYHELNEQLDNAFYGLNYDNNDHSEQFTEQPHNNNGDDDNDDAYHQYADDDHHAVVHIHVHKRESSYNNKENVDYSLHKSDELNATINHDDRMEKNCSENYDDVKDTKKREKVEDQSERDTFPCGQKLFSANSSKPLHHSKKFRSTISSSDCENKKEIIENPLSVTKKFGKRQSGAVTLKRTKRNVNSADKMHFEKVKTRIKRKTLAFKNKEAPDERIRQQCDDIVTQHCLNLSHLWYTVFQMQKPFILQEIGMQIYMKQTKKWIELTKGNILKLGTFFHQAKDGQPTIVATYSNTPHIFDIKSIPIQYDNHVLLVPSHFRMPAHKHNFPEGLAGPEEYLVIPDDDVTAESHSCDKIGTFFEGFASDISRCEKKLGDCLHQQPIHLWTHDMQRHVHGKRGRYFVRNYGDIPNPLASSHLLQGDYLALLYHGRYQSTIEVELRADINTIIRPGGAGRIQSIYVDNAAHSIHTTIEVLIMNYGLAPGQFRVVLSECLNDFPKAYPRGSLELLAPQQSHLHRLRIDEMLPDDPVHCTILLVNENDAMVASREMIIQRQHRCLCAYHCECECVLNYQPFTCSIISRTEYEDAGFNWPPPQLPHARQAPWGKLPTRHDCWIIFLLWITVLLLFGKLKGCIGLYRRDVWDYGLDFFRTPKNNCDMGPIQTLIEVFLNAFFFLLYPIKLIGHLILFGIKSFFSLFRSSCFRNMSRIPAWNASSNGRAGWSRGSVHNESEYSYTFENEEDEDECEDELPTGTSRSRTPSD